MAKAKVLFMFVSPDANPSVHRNTIIRPSGREVITIGVKDYQQGVEVSKELIKEGVSVIELCAGFGNIGTAMIVKAVERKIPVGVVRFDYHPSLNFKSGDELFQ